jgi:hypothetical protein
MKRYTHTNLECYIIIIIIIKIILCVAMQVPDSGFQNPAIRSVEPLGRDFDLLHSRQLRRAQKTQNTHTYLYARTELQTTIPAFH